jgi:hypothetical protein
MRTLQDLHGERNLVTSTKRLSVYTFDELVRGLYQGFTDILGEGAPSLNTELELDQTPIHKLDVYHTFRCVRTYFRESCKAFPWEFDMHTLRAYTTSEIAKMLIDIAILAVSGNLPPSERITPRDLRATEEVGENSSVLIALVDAFLKALRGESFAREFEHHRTADKLALLVAHATNASIKIPIASKRQMKLAMQFLKKHGDDQAGKLGEYLNGVFKDFVDGNKPIPDDAWEKACNDFLRALNSTTQTLS